ncbi:MAG: excinuclease ABC subunit UvrC [Thermoanaerobaculum sp.]|nr:excinuclease ABC subunit UvrC [Thermoanaerobaculum sp.]
MEQKHPLWELAARAPQQPGVYLYCDGRGKVLYIGKARDLRRRVLSYFTKEPPPKTAQMLARARELRFVVTRTEVEALILENQLIKQHRPRYNVLLRDDKTYPYIKLTTAEAWPRAMLVRKVERDGNHYYGPFLGHGTAARLMDLIRMYSQVRTCAWDLKPDGTLPRPCLYHAMGACLAPCVAGMTTRERYREAVREVQLLLEGKTGELEQVLVERMWEASEQQDYERAARYRDLARAVKSLGEGQVTELPGHGSFDVLGMAGDGRDVSLVVLVYRQGKLSDKREFHFEGIEMPVGGELLSEFIPQYYEVNPAIPEQVLLPVALEDLPVLREFLVARAGRGVELVVPRRGQRRKLIGLAEENAQEAFRLRFRHPVREGERLGLEVQQLLGLSEKVQRIECFDVSHTGGEAAVVSVVVWEQGTFSKRDYRSFNVKTPAPGDDFAALREAVRRRYVRQLRERRPLPQVVLVDGGQGQLAVVQETLATVGWQPACVALAKRQEALYLQGQEGPLHLPANHPVRLLFQRLRDEAHRFAVTRHRRRRRARRLATQLLMVPGIGPTRAKKLLTAFGSLEAVQNASEEEMALVVGRKLARMVKTWFRQEQASGSRHP